MARRTPSLTALRAGESAARTGSFTAAARELAVTRPAISKQILLLEEELSCPLFDRSGQNPTLTLIGDELFATLKHSFDSIATTVSRVKTIAAAASNHVRLLVEQDFASLWLAERIGQFLLQNPGVSVEVVASSNGEFRQEENFSYTIFYESPQNMAKTELATQELCRWIDTPLCSPEYARRLQGEDGFRLSEAHLLHDRTFKSWENWLSAASLSEQIDVKSGTQFNETSLCLAAAIAGTGITIGDNFLACCQILDGSLVAPFKRG